MSIFKRIKDIVDARINDLLDGLEHPIDMINQTIREMENSIVDMRKTVTSAIAMHRLTETRLEKAIQSRVTWQENAEFAVREKKDDLARKAIEKRHGLDNQTTAYERELQEHVDLADDLKHELQLVEEKVQEARRKRETLLTRQRAVETRTALLEGSGAAKENLPAAPVPTS